jgi:predicted transposase YbfD/YdcC
MKKTNTPQGDKKLYALLGQIPDFRRPQGRIHSLQQILVIIIMALMSGYLGYRAMGDFAMRNQNELVKLFKSTTLKANLLKSELKTQLKNRLKIKMPSFPTIRRIAMQIDFKDLSKIFLEWAKQFVSIGDQDWLHLDGKAIKGTLADYNNEKQRFLNLVTAFSSKRKQAIGVNLVNNSKESEIPKIRELIQTLKLKDKIFTADALHCQKETSKTIVETGNNYVLQVKSNQKKLLRQLQINSFTEKTDPSRLVSTYTSTELNRGRLETRTCEVFNNLEGINQTEWHKLKCFIKVTRQTLHKDGHEHNENCYFISSLNPKSTPACQFSKGIREHWSIEAFHYIKDVTLKEDSSKIRSGNAPENLSVLRNIALNILNNLGFSNTAQAIRLVSNDIPKLSKLVLG